VSPRKHSFPPVIDPEVRLLVLGSLPGERSLAEQRYYAHPQNQFWRLISPAAGRDLTLLDYDARLAALLEAHIGLWDVVASAHRTGSTDAAIREAEAHDIAALAATLPRLRAIAFNGATAYRQGMRQLGSNMAKFATIPLPSSSPLHTVGLAAKLPAWAGLLAYIT
jgi:hypoxanthine-DNA glycosylase